MNEAEELAVAEALNQLRQRKDQQSERSSPASSGGAATSSSSASPPPEGEIGMPSKPKGKIGLEANAKDGTALGTQGANGTQSTQNLSSTQSTHGKEKEPHKARETDNNETILTEGYTTQTSNAPAQPSSSSSSQGQPHQWRSVLLTATSLVLTKDTRRKLRQLLKVLRLASEHLNSKVKALKDDMESDADHDNKTPKISHAAVRNDIITTIKKCLAMLSTMATNTLPTSISNHIRCTLLKLPSRWADQLGNESSSLESDGKSESAVLALATETLLCIQNIINILADSVDRADSWVERLPDFQLRKRRRTDEEIRAGDSDVEKEAMELLGITGAQTETSTVASTSNDQTQNGSEQTTTTSRRHSPEGPETKAPKLEKDE